MATQFETEVLSHLGDMNRKIDDNARETKQEFKDLKSDVSEITTTLHDHVLKDEITQQIRTESANVGQTKGRITASDIKSFLKVAGLVAALFGGSFAGFSSCDDLHPAPAIHQNTKVSLVDTEEEIAP